MPLPLYNPTTQPASYRTIGIAAGKGGVGKSTITVNLAMALKQQGYAVGILDADLYGPSTRCMLAEDRLPRQQGERLIPALCSGIKLISMAYFNKEHEAAAIRAPYRHRIITQFLKQVDWGISTTFLSISLLETGDITNDTKSAG